MTLHRKFGLGVLAAAVMSVGAFVPDASAEVVCKTTGSKLFPSYNAVCVEATLGAEDGTPSPSVWVGCTLFNELARCAIPRIEPL